MVKNLRYLRERDVVSQEQVARAIGVTQQTINKYENQSTEPDIEILGKLANFFNTSIDFLVGNTDIERKYEILYNTDLNESELKLMEGYRGADAKGKSAIDAVIEALVKKKE